MRCPVLKHAVLQVTDVAEKENQEPVADQIITTEPKLNVSFCRVLFTLNKYVLFLPSLVNLYSRNSWTVVSVTLCGCGIRCPTSREEYRLRVCDSRVVRRTSDVRGRLE